MNIDDIYSFTNKEKVIKALDKNKRGIKNTNIFIFTMGILLVTYVYLSFSMNIENVVNIIVYLVFSLTSIITNIILKHKHTKYDFLYSLNEYMKEDNTNKKDDKS